MTETKWKEEKKRRINTEKRLRLAEDSLKRLDRALRDSGVQIDLQIETDVKNLKSSFTVYLCTVYKTTLLIMPRGVAAQGIR